MPYPKDAGHKGAAETGPDGSRRIGRRVRHLRQKVLGALETGPATAEQIAERVGEHWMIIRARCSELTAQGLIADSGMRGGGALGGKVIVRRLTTPQERAAWLAAKEAEAQQ